MDEGAPLQAWDLAAIVTETRKSGAIWSTAGADLNVNLVVFRGEHGVAPHVNDAVDVLGVVLEGEGTLVIDGRPLALRRAHAFYIPRGSMRSIRSSGDSLVYLTCHVKRGRLQIEPAQR